MIEVNAVFDKKRVTAMSKGKRITNYIIFSVLGVALAIGGVVTLINDTEGANLIPGIVMIAACPVIILLTVFMSRNEMNTNVAAFGVDKGEIVLNYKFAARSAQITRTAFGKVETEVLRYSELYKVKRTKKHFLLYINKEEMFYVPCDCFVSGTPDELFKLFYDNKVILDY